LASAVSLVGDWALSAKLVDADEIDEVLLMALNDRGPVLAATVAFGAVECPPLYSSTPGEGERCMFTVPTVYIQ